jgi:hypothetical protein
MYHGFLSIEYPKILNSPVFLSTLGWAAKILLIKKNGFFFYKLNFISNNLQQGCNNFWWKLS